MFHGFYWIYMRCLPSMITKKNCPKDVPIYHFGFYYQEIFHSFLWWPIHPWTFSFTASCPRFLEEFSLAIWDFVPDFVCLLFLRLYNEWVKSNFQATQCLKIIEKVSFLHCELRSYVYILSGQKFIKNAKNCPFWRIFDKLKLVVKQCYQTGNF